MTQETYGGYPSKESALSDLLEKSNELARRMDERRAQRKAENEKIPFEQHLAEYYEHMKPRRIEWGPGPWKKEPLRKEFRAHGFDCLIIRAPLGHLCGYVGLPPDHPLYGKHYDELPDEIDVHGGVTYGEECGGHICHRPAPGESDHLFWVGFDCAHYNDLSPYETSRMSRYIQRKVREDMRAMGYTDSRLNALDYEERMGKKYRPFNWVRMETKRLARQLRKIAAAEFPA